MKPFSIVVSNSNTNCEPLILTLKQYQLLWTKSIFLKSIFQPLMNHFGNEFVFRVLYKLFGTLDFIRRSEKRKNWKSILSIVWKPTKGLWPLFKWEKIQIIGIQIDQFRLTVSTQKLFLKNMHWVPRYLPKCVKFCWFGFEDFFGNISELVARYC